MIAPHVRETPVVTAAAEDFGLAGAPIAFKLELLQHAGSSSRAAPSPTFCCATCRRPAWSRRPAATTARRSRSRPSASACRRKIFVPTVASPAKIAQIRSYGAELVVEGARYADALALSEDWAAKTGALQIHAFDQPETLLGQGTVAREFARPGAAGDDLAGGGRRRRPDRRHGGLERGPRTRSSAVEPEAAPTLHMARAAGEPGGCAGRRHRRGFAGAQAGRRLMFPIAQRYVAESVLVPDEAIREAQRALWRVLRVVAEPGGAAAFAALLSGAYQPAPGRTRRRAGLRRQHGGGGFRPGVEPTGKVHTHSAACQARPWHATSFVSNAEWRQNSWMIVPSTPWRTGRCAAEF